MPHIIGYGEDARTLWACTRCLPVILEQLEDPSAPEDCLFFYRPSFGRKGGAYSSEFGEFDGILATRRCVYPIESKWLRAAVRDGRVALAERQVLRHEIFQWLREHWKAGMTWTDFTGEYREAFSTAFPVKHLAPVGSCLADNIEQILNMLAAFPPNLEHVLLAIYHDPRIAPREVAHYRVPFRLVRIPCESMNPGGLFSVTL